MSGEKPAKSFSAPVTVALICQSDRVNGPWLVATGVCPLSRHTWKMHPEYLPVWKSALIPPLEHWIRSCKNYFSLALSFEISLILF